MAGCAKQNADQTAGLGGGRRRARQPAGLHRQCRRSRLLRKRFVGTDAAGRGTRSTSRRSGSISTAAMRSPSKATPTSAARVSTTSHSAPAARRPCSAYLASRGVRRSACTPSPTARNGRWRCVTIFPAGRRIAAPSRCSTRVPKSGLRGYLLHRPSQMAGLAAAILPSWSFRGVWSLCRVGFACHLSSCQGAGEIGSCALI